MKIFSINDIKIFSVRVIARDPSHATHMLLRALHNSIGYFPRIEHSIEHSGFLEGSEDRFQEMFAQRRAGFLRYENGWKLHLNEDDNYISE